MGNHSEAFVGFDTSKLRHAVAIAEAGRTGDVRFIDEIENAGRSSTEPENRRALSCGGSKRVPDCGASFANRMQRPRSAHQMVAIVASEQSVTAIMRQRHGDMLRVIADTK